MLEDQCQDRGPEERDDARRRGRDIAQLGARGRGDYLCRDQLHVRVAGIDSHALALADGSFHDTLVDLVGEQSGEDPRVVLVDGVDLVDDDFDDALLPVAERSLGVVGRHDRHVDRSAADAGLSSVAIRRHLDDVESRPGELLVGRGISGHLARGRCHDDGLERPSDSAVPEPEDRHDQERTEDQAQDGARPPEGLNELFADEREDADDDRQRGSHQTSAPDRSGSDAVAPSRLISR